MTEQEACFNFKPDSEHINALPEPLREFIRDTMEQRAIPAGDLRTVAELREQNAALQRLIEKLKAQIRD